MEIVTRTATIDRAKSDDNQMTFVISTESVDSYGTVFKSDGWDIQAYSRNPLVTYGHPSLNDPDPNVIVAKSEVYMDEDRLMARITNDMWDDGNDKAAAVRRKLMNGTLNMTSIRATVEDGYFGDKQKGEDPDIFYFTNQRLMDWGVVMHGANPDAVKRGADELIERAKKELLQTPKRRYSITARAKYKQTITFSK